MNEFLDCVYARISDGLQRLSEFLLVGAIVIGAGSLLILAACVVHAIIVTAGAGIGLCFQIAGMILLVGGGMVVLLVALGFVYVVLEAVVDCACLALAGVGAVADIGAALPASGDLPSDCAAASALLASSLQRLAAAQAARDAAADRARRARHNLRVAVAGLAGATVAIAATLFRPDLWAGVAAALITATALVVRRTRRRAEAEAALAVAEAALVEAIAATAAAETLARQLCRPPERVPPGAEGLGLKIVLPIARKSGATVVRDEPPIPIVPPVKDVLQNGARGVRSPLDEQ